MRAHTLAGVDGVENMGAAAELPPPYDTSAPALFPCHSAATPLHP